MTDDKRNPAYVRGDTESDAEYLKRLGEVIQKLEWQSDGHRMWYTHRNPYGCWICEIFQTVRLLSDNYAMLLEECVSSDATKSESSGRRRKRLKKSKS